MPDRSGDDHDEDAKPSLAGQYEGHDQGIWRGADHMTNAGPSE